MGFPGDSVGKESACNVGDPGSVPGSVRFHGEGHGSPLQYSCRKNPHGQRGLEGHRGCNSTATDTLCISIYIMYFHINNVSVVKSMH